MMDDTVVAGMERRGDGMRTPKRAERILEMYLDSPDNMPAGLRGRCQEWLCDDAGWDGKEEVLRDFFDKIPDMPAAASGDDSVRFSQVAGRLGLTGPLTEQR